MKRIFLTSGLVLCMACPAFADFTSSEADSATLNGACVEPRLGVYDGPTTLKAKWNKNWYNIVLDSNIGTAVESGGATPAAPTPIYAAKGTPGVYTIKDDSGDLSNLVSAGSSPITTAAAGIEVNYLLDYNLPTDPETGLAYTAPTTASSSTAAERGFLGFYSEASDMGVQYIGADGNLTAAGATAASTATADQTWVAKWGLAQPTLGSNPTLLGYDFTGWKDSASAEPGLIGIDTTIYAQWEAHTGTLSYNCGTAPGTTAFTSSTAPMSETLTYDDDFVFASNTCTLPGYVFAGWECNYNLASGENVSKTYQPNDNGIYKVAADNASISCYAQWTADSISITWDVNGATSGNTTTNTCSYDGTVELPTKPERTGYEFGGWEVANNQ